MQPPGSLRTHYLIDYESRRDAETLEAMGGYLVVFNPGSAAADLDVTVYVANREPERFALQARPGATTASPVSGWPVRPEGRFALRVEASRPVVAQATLGWNNTGGDSSPSAVTRASRVREAATSYQSTPALARRWYLADGIVLDDRKRLWYRESEWTLVLNPNDEPARVELGVFYRWFTRTHVIEVPARRLRAVRMDDLVMTNRHYGLRVASDRPVVVHSRRDVFWYDATELMTLWSVPLVALAER